MPAHIVFAYRAFNLVVSEEIGCRLAATAIPNDSQDRPSGRSFFAPFNGLDPGKACDRGATDSRRASEIFQFWQALNGLCDTLAIEPARAHFVCGE